MAIPPYFTLLDFEPVDDDDEDEDDGWYLGDSKLIDLREIFEDMQAVNNPPGQEPPSHLRLIEGLGWYQVSDD